MNDSPTSRERQVLEMAGKANELSTKALREMIRDAPVGMFRSKPVGRSTRPRSSPMKHRWRALLSGGRGRRFKSSHSDQNTQRFERVTDSQCGLARRVIIYGSPVEAPRG
jgi:hypothetical protein